jgi:hypothetical protein
MLRGDEQRSQIRTISDNQIKTIEKLLNETQSDEVRFLSWLQVGHIKDILAMDYDRAIAGLEAKK